MAMLINVLAVICVLITITSARRNCTQLNNSNPCHCEHGKFGRRLICPRITSELNLNLVLQCVNRFHVSEIVIDDSELRYISSDAFQGTSYRRIHIRGTTLVSLSNTRQAFKGLEDQLEELMVERGSYVSNWDWSNLKHLKKLSTIEVVNTDYVYATGFEDLVLPNLTKLVLKKNGMTGISENAFTSLTNLRELILTDNEIKDVERGMFPKPADFLENINLSNNSIRLLPIGIFSEMPALKMLFLSGNHLHSIYEKVFSPIWPQLKFINFRSNPIICDCRLKWIPNSEQKPGQVFAECTSPDDLKGTSLSTLKATDLWCG